MMGYLLHGSVYRIPISVYVDNTHKDGNHEPTIVEVFILIHFFYNYYSTIGRCHHYFLGVFLAKQADRASEKIHQHSIQDNTYHSYDIEWQFAFNPK